MKRAFDLAVAGGGLLLVWPILAVVAMAIILDDGRPILFRQERVGRGGQPFQLIKFRTMRAEAGTEITVGADPRVTRVGQVLRRWKLDELPQLVNVVRGEMSLVGPRPELPRYVHEHRDLFGQILHLRPGITDPASLTYRDEAAQLALAANPDREYRERILPDKVRISAAYAAHATVCSDIGVILRTVGGR